MARNKIESKEQKAIELSQRLGKHYSEKKVETIEKKKDKYSSKEKLKAIWDKIEFLWTKLKSKETPLKVKIAIFGGFAYLLLPIDIISDYIPVAGFVDDAAVFLYVWRTVVPYFTKTVTEIAEEVAAEKIKVALNGSFKTTIIRASIVLAVNIIATLISCFLPFGEIPSKYVASFLFAATLCYSIYRTIRWIVKNGSMAFNVTVQVLKTKSIRKGIANYVRCDDRKIFRQISKTFRILDAASQMTDLDLPTLEDEIHNCIKRFLKSLLLFFIFYMLYVILVYWILKPFILTHYAGMNTFQLIIYPVSQLISSLRATL